MNRMKLITVMMLWGSLGVLTRSIPVAPLNLAFLRAFIALPVLYFAMRFGKRGHADWRQLVPYCISGIFLGFGWLTLFYGFRHTSISSAVLIYNMCPVYVMVLAPFILKEAFSKIKGAAICSSFIGLLLIIGPSLSDRSGIDGMAMSAASGMLYAAIVLINRSVKNRLDDQTATFVQILSAMLVLLPFVLAESTLCEVLRLDQIAILKIILLGVLHTGAAYTIFFSLYASMRSIEIVSYSYLEPFFSILFSVCFAGERLSALQITGGILILGSTYLGELVKGDKPLAQIDGKQR